MAFNCGALDFKRRHNDVQSRLGVPFQTCSRPLGSGSDLIGRRREAVVGHLCIGATDGLLRLSTGLEAASDLVADLASAL